VDFRVDADGRPWILEVNANPCLSPDAGFLAAAARVRLTPRRVVERIVEAAFGGTA
jgi:D-alanine-D-alanine ligase